MGGQALKTDKENLPAPTRRVRESCCHFTSAVLASPNRGILRPAAALVFLLLLVTLAGCSFIDGVAVDSYLKDAGGVQSSVNDSLAGLNADVANVRSGDENKTRDALDHLGQERDAVGTAHDRLEGIEAPEAAGSLKNDLNELYDEGDQLLGELIAEGNYRLAMDPLLKDYDARSQSFSAQVREAKDAASLTRCLKNYAQQVRDMDGRVAKLTPPDSLIRSHARLIYNLRVLESGLNDTVSGFENGDQAQLGTASKKMARIDGSNAQLSQEMDGERDTDISSYNLRVHRLDALNQQVGQDIGQLRQRFDRK